jgi:hypothetical protein
MAMRTAGKAFTTGLFTTLGVGVAIVGTMTVLVIVGERQVKRIVSEFDAFLATKSEDLMTAVYGASKSTDGEPE